MCGKPSSSESLVGRLNMMLERLGLGLGIGMLRVRVRVRSRFRVRDVEWTRRLKYVLPIR